MKAVKETIEKKDKKPVEVVRVEIVGAPEEKKAEKKKGFFKRLTEREPEKTKHEIDEAKEKEEVLEHAKLDKHEHNVEAKADKTVHKTRGMTGSKTKGAVKQSSK